MYKTIVRTLWLIYVALGMVACANISRDIASDGTHAKELRWPSPDSATPIHKGGTFPQATSLRQVQAGLNKQQIIDLIGPPHFSEGVFGVREWNYLFNFRKPGSSEVQQCQYKILFDEHMLARSFYWKPESCADWLVEKSPAPATPAKNEQTFTLSSDALFDFDKYQASDIKPHGREQLTELASKIIAAGDAIKQVRIVGYTDRLGSAPYNHDLSQRRAATVDSFLREHGVSSQEITAEGRGESDPVIQCNDTQRAALIACLAPNRRVEVTVSGSK